MGGNGLLHGIQHHVVMCKYKSAGLKLARDQCGRRLCLGMCSRTVHFHDKCLCKPTSVLPSFFELFLQVRKLAPTALLDIDVQNALEFVRQLREHLHLHAAYLESTVQQPL
tara:strand:- start:324 stop:656 length:333 start_codon:yes stop_codon:yes gene_type:complete